MELENSWKLGPDMKANHRSDPRQLLAEYEFALVNLRADHDTVIDRLENVMRNARLVMGRVSRWNDKSDQVARWMGVALLRAQEGFRRIRGHKEPGALATALERAGAADLSMHSAVAEMEKAA